VPAGPPTGEGALAPLLEFAEERSQHRSVCTGADGERIRGVRGEQFLVTGEGAPRGGIGIEAPCGTGVTGPLERRAHIGGVDT
jgi:hypothetical protein